MKLEHIALSIFDPQDIEKFYCDIFGMNQVRSFNLSKVLAKNIFGIDNETSVFLLQKDELILEIFVTQEKNTHSFNHICISIIDREKLVKKAEQNGYECIRIERDTSDLIFIKDKHENIFEIKEKI
ncbi:MAG: VOC family protein [Bacteroidales bacterium]|nr:VOC family protein [Bacteroidales bacterium]